jgi:hypothetical protein
MSEIDKTFQETILNALTTLLSQNKFDTDTQLDIYQSIKKAASDVQEIQVNKLRRKIEDWESMYEGADTTLYTLGLRHAIDIITGETATDVNGFDGQKYEKGSIKEDEL